MANLGLGLLLAGIAAGTTTIPIAVHHRAFELLNNRLLMPEVVTRLRQLRQDDTSGETCRPWSDLSALKPTAIRVYIQKSDSGAAEVAQAAAIWNANLGERVFTLTNSETTADAYVTSEPKVKMDGSTLAGLTSWVQRKGIGSGLEVQVQLSERGPQDQVLSPADRLNACLHEFGHVLGLDDDHIRGGIMGPLILNKPKDHPAPAEVEAVKELRQASAETLTCER